jgi:alpha-tubulin suppressor-like RCC1 family protein
MTVVAIGGGRPDARLRCAPRAALGLLAVVGLLAGCRLVGVSSADGGYASTCAVVDGGVVRCWGDNDYGQLGDGTTTDQEFVATTVVGIANAADVAVGEQHACALLDDGTVRCWGRRSEFQLGDGLWPSESEYSTVPVEVVGIASAVQIDAGEHHTCAVLESGSIECWGSNADGQLGFGWGWSTVPEVASGISTAVEVAAADRHTCALLADGSVMCWGDDDWGQLGNGAAPGSGTPVSVAGLTGVDQLSAGGRHTCALAVEQWLACWGTNFSGELGDGTLEQRDAPVMALGVDFATQVVTGSEHTCVNGAGTPHCWGRNHRGQLGDGTRTNRSVPTPVAISESVASIETGDDHTCALVLTDQLRCWGWNFHGQLGDGSRPWDALLPVVPAFEVTTTTPPPSTTTTAP